MSKIHESGKGESRGKVISRKDAAQILYPFRATVLLEVGGEGRELASDQLKSWVL